MAVLLGVSDKFQTKWKLNRPERGQETQFANLQSATLRGKDYKGGFKLLGCFPIALSGNVGQQLLTWSFLSLSGHTVWCFRSGLTVQISNGKAFLPSNVQGRFSVVPFFSKKISFSFVLYYEIDSTSLQTVYWPFVSPWCLHDLTWSTVHSTEQSCPKN